MFTGIIEELGSLKTIRPQKNALRLTIAAKKILEDIHLGDSIAVNGICLSVVDFHSDSFSADVMQETLSRTSLSQLKPGSPVNLERAMALGGRFGGHIVSGHIDGTGTITRIHKDGIAVWYTIQAAPSILKYIVEKGSVALDGISLTVASVSQDSFQVSVIPHTLENTILPRKNVRDLINIENDCIGKYVEKLLKNEEQTPKGITREFLLRSGF